MLNRFSGRLALSLIGLSVTAHAAISQDGETIPTAAENPTAETADGRPLDNRLCKSTDEYIKTLTFLRTSKELVLPESSSRLIADKVSRGCTGASQRFSEVLMLMKTVGVSDPRALEIALRFASQSPDVQKNFKEIFSKSFLSEFFDYDYSLAVTLAVELSQEYKGDPARVREDFIQLAKFCREAKSLDLPVRTCAQYAIKMARLSEYFPGGVREPFMSFYKKLREDRDYGFDIKTSLEVCHSVLKNGPLAIDNFSRAYSYAMKKDGLDMGRREALAFGLRMAGRSFDGEAPPSYSGDVDAEQP